MDLYGLVGAGGFAREIMPHARQSMQNFHLGGRDEEAVFVVEDAYPIPAPIVNGHRVLSMSEFLSAPAAARFFNIGIGNSKVRERIANSIPRDKALPFAVIARSHEVGDENELGEGAVLCAFTHILCNTKIGKFFHANFHSCVAHDVVIGDFVTLAPSVMINGNAVVEDHAYIGTGAVIRDATKAPIVIGRGAVVGMGAVVTKSVPAGATVVGNPAKVMSTT